MTKPENAFVLMSNFVKQAKQVGLPVEYIDKVLAEAQTGDYDHLCEVLRNGWKYIIK